MMDICHMKMRDPNLAARASDKIGLLQDWDVEPNLAGAKRIEKKAQSCCKIGMKSGKWKVEKWKIPISHAPNLVVTEVVTQFFLFMAYCSTAARPQWNTGGCWCGVPFCQPFPKSPPNTRPAG
jgi:hypothetical protein